jgi:hypothetical protein
MLPKLEELRRYSSPMCYDELSAVSKDLVSLTCMKGFDFITEQDDISSLIFQRLENVLSKSENDSELHFITTVLENSIPQGRGFLKSLQLSIPPSALSTTNSSVVHAQFTASLIKIIEVRGSLLRIGISWNEFAETDFQLQGEFGLLS